MKKLLYFLGIVLIVFFYSVNLYSAEGEFSPPQGKTLIIIGHDKDTIDEYVNSVGITPAGFMVYTSVQEAQALYSPADWGSGVNYAQYLADKYQDTVFQIGLYIVDVLDGVIRGQYDSNIERIGNWIKSVKRPVYLRIGYEFDYPGNHYDPYKYKMAYCHIVDKLRAMGVDNVAFVWHSCASAGCNMMDWYPGDEYVDWFAISYFKGRTPQMDTMADFAVQHGKPFMIAESTPYGMGTHREYVWNQWFKSLFDFVKEKDVRILCYINANWDAQPMWQGQGWGDARVQANPEVKRRWLAEITQGRYINSISGLYKLLGYKGSRAAGGLSTSTSGEEQAGSSSAKTQIATVSVTSSSSFTTSNALNIEYILDASNSMNDPLPSAELKIDVAKRVICNLIDNLATEVKGNVNVGLRIYGANFDPTKTKEVACRDSVLVVPVKGIDAQLIKSKVMETKAAGYTPLAYSLELASKDFPSGEGNTNVIILVSDGKETCGGDPVGVIKKLKEQGFNVVVHCIGLAVDEEAKKQLEEIAMVGGGVYYTAESAEQLTELLKKITEEEVKKYREKAEYEAVGKEVKGGSWVDDAPEVEPGEYKGEVGMHEMKWYKLKVKEGEKIKAVAIVKKTPYEAEGGYIRQVFSLTVVGEDGLIKAEHYETVEGVPAEPITFKCTWTAEETGWVYVGLSASKNWGYYGLTETNPPNPTCPYTIRIKIKGRENTECLNMTNSEKSVKSLFISFKVLHCRVDLSTTFYLYFGG